MDIMGQKESFQKLAHSNYSSIFSRLVQKTRGICSRTVACCICFGAFCIISRGTVGNKTSPELQMKKRYFMYYWYHSGLGVKFTEMKLERSLNRALNLVRCVHRQCSGLYFFPRVILFGNSPSSFWTGQPQLASFHII